MLRKDVQLLRKIILPYKIDPVQEFPENNLFLYFYLSDILVFQAKFM